MSGLLHRLVLLEIAMIPGDDAAALQALDAMEQEDGAR